jgi:hypothetical protein
MYVRTHHQSFPDADSFKLVRGEIIGPSQLSPTHGHNLVYGFPDV